MKKKVKGWKKNISCKLNIDTKCERDITRKENYRPVSLMKQLTKNPKEYTSKWNPAIYKKG